MAIKFWQLKLEGTKSIDEIQASVGRDGANVVRIDVEGSETQVYLAGDESLHPQLSRQPKRQNRCVKFPKLT